MPEPERKRRRPAISCTACRRRKIRCDRAIPCNNCLRSREGASACRYVSFPSQELPDSPPNSNASDAGHDHHHQPHHDELADSSGLATPSGGSTIISPPSIVQPLQNNRNVPTTSASLETRSHPSHDEMRLLRRRLETLEAQLASKTGETTLLHPPSAAASQNSHVEADHSGLGGTVYLHYETRSSDSRPQPITRSVTHKGRMFGQSHWMNSFALIRDVILAVEPRPDDASSKILTGLQKCKTMGRMIKARRLPEWPVIPTIDLPAKDICDQLVDSYIRTSETIYRVQHIPSFMREYEALWAAPVEAVGGFLIQLKLVLAIGASVHDDKFSLRPSALRWIYEAQTWLTDPAKSKSRLGLQFLQSNILLMLARAAVNVGEDLVWTCVGSVYRMAVFLGLHRDPVHLPRKTALCAEIRRRLWNTILELVLESSLLSGAPPLLSLDDFDCEPPLNLDDSDIPLPSLSSSAADGGGGGGGRGGGRGDGVTGPGSSGSEEAAVQQPRPETVHTQVTAARVLRRTLPQRLAILRLLNEFRSPETYGEVIRLDAEFREAHRSVTRSLGVCDAPDHAVRAVDFVMRRYRAALHTPFYSAALVDATYEYSRRMAVETSALVWRTAFPDPWGETAPQQQDEEQPQPSPGGGEQGLFQSTTATASTRLRDGTRNTSNNTRSNGSDDVSSSLSPSPSALHNQRLRKGISIAGRPSVVTLIKSAVIVGADLKTRLHENEGMGGTGAGTGLLPTMLDDQLQILHEARDMSLAALEAGDTNVKGYLLAVILIAYLEAQMMRPNGGSGGGRETVGSPAFVRVVVAAGVAAVERCVVVLEGVLAATATDDAAVATSGPYDEVGSGGIGAWSLDLGPPINGWDFPMTDALFGFDDPDPANWLFSGTTTVP